MPRAISYVRFSHARQRLGASLKRQLERTYAYCKRNDLVLDESYRLNDSAVSAFKGKNFKEGELAGFLRDCESGKIAPGTFLIIESLDRLTRADIGDALQLFLRIVGHGVKIVTLDPERIHDTTTINKIEGLLEPLIVLSRANEESTTKSGRIGDAWERRRKDARNGKGKGGHRPWWIDYVDGEYHLVPERADVVREIFRLKIAGNGTPSIAKALNNQPVKPRFASLWNSSTVDKILKSRSVFGEYQPKRLVEGKEIPEGLPVPGYYPAVLTEAIFYQAQTNKGRRGRTQADGHNNLFQGLLVGEDGYPIHVLSNNQTSAKTRKTTNYQYMISQAKTLGLPGAVPYRIRYPHFEQAFLRFVKELDPRDFVQGDTTVANEIAALTGVIAGQTHRIDQIKARIKTESDFEILLSLLSEIEKERKEQVAKLEVLKAQQYSSEVEQVGELQSLASLLQSVPDDEKLSLKIKIRGRIRQLIARILVLVTPTGRVGNRPQMDILAICQFRDGRERWLATNQDGELIANGTVASNGSTDNLHEMVKAYDAYLPSLKEKFAMGKMARLLAGYSADPEGSLEQIKKLMKDFPA